MLNMFYTFRKLLTLFSIIFPKLVFFILDAHILFFLLKRDLKQSIWDLQILMFKTNKRYAQYARMAFTKLNNNFAKEKQIPELHKK